MLIGLQLCRQLHFSKVWNESNSQVAISLLNHSNFGHWTLQPVLVPLPRLISQMDVQVTHVLGEANKVADSLANLAVRYQNNFFFSHQQCSY